MIKKCAYCGETIPEHSKRCSFCGSILEPGKPEDALEQHTESPDSSEGFSAGSGYEEDAFKNGRVYYGLRPPASQAPLSNALKVFLTAICVLVPGLGQLAGIIIAIVFMNSEENADKRSFGLALLVASLIVFVLACLLSCLMVVWIRQVAEMYPEIYAR